MASNDNYRLSFIDESSGALKKAPKSEQKKGASSTSIDLKSKSTEAHLASSNSKTDTSISLSSAIASQVFLKNAQSSSVEVTNNSDIFTEDGVEEYAIKDGTNRAPVTSDDSGILYSELSNSIADNANDLNASQDYSASTNEDAISDKSLLNIEEAKAFAYNALKEVAESLAAQSEQNKYKSFNNYLSGSRSSLGGAAADNISDGNRATSSASGTSNPYASIMETVDEAVSSAINSDKDVDLNIGDNYKKKKDIKKIDLLKEPKYDIVNYDLEAIEKSLIDPPTKYDELVYPDAQSNMYDVYFRIVERDGEVDRAFTSGSGVLDTLLNSNLLSARITSITIPSRVRESTSITFSGTSYDRQTDIINDPGKSSFTIRGDTRLYYVDIMNELSGTSIGSMFGKGSALMQGLSNLVAVEIAKSMKEEIQAAEDIMKIDLEKANENYQNDLTKIRVKLLSDAAYKYDGVDELENIKAALKATENDPTAYAVTLKELADSKASQYIILLKDKQKAAVQEARNKSTDRFKALNEAMKEKKAVQQQIDAIEAALKKAHKQEQEAMKKFAAASKAAKEKLKNTEKAVNDKARKAAANIKFDIDTGEALAYITSAITKNMLISVKPAESIDDIRKARRLDIVVKRTSAGPRFQTELSEKKDERFVFEDVKLLGTSDPISFTKDSADIQEFTYDFIYKRCYKVDLYDTTGNWVASQIKQFIDDNVDVNSIADALI